METVDTTKRLGDLRKLMQEHKVDVYSMAAENPYPQSETELNSHRS
jgi:hypothetical protein